MKTAGFLAFCVIAAVCATLSSCSNDEETERVKLLSSIRHTGENKEIILEYDSRNRLVKLTETGGEASVTTLTYGDGEVLVEKFGAYYGKFILNEQGYAKEFERDYTPTCYYEYSTDGFLTKSDNQQVAQTYLYANGDLIECPSSRNSCTLTPSEDEDAYGAPAPYQPVVWLISGNSETLTGYLAGLYGKSGKHLTKQLSYTSEAGEEWEMTSISTYKYTFDKEGYVTQMVETIQGPEETVITDPITYSYTEVAKVN